MGQDEKHFWVAWSEFDDEPALTPLMTSREAADWFREERGLDSGGSYVIKLVRADEEDVRRFEVVSEVREVTAVRALAQRGLERLG